MKHKMQTVYEITSDVYYLFNKFLQTYISAVIQDITLQKKGVTSSITELYRQFMQSGNQEISQLDCHLTFSHLLRRKRTLMKIPTAAEAPSLFLKKTFGDIQKFILFTYHRYDRSEEFLSYKRQPPRVADPTMQH